MVVPVRQTKVQVVEQGVYCKIHVRNYWCERILCLFCIIVVPFEKNNFNNFLIVFIRGRNAVKRENEGHSMEPKDVTLMTSCSLHTC